MKTLALFIDSSLPVPTGTAWYLDTLGEFRGKQELYTRQSPQKLRVLREHAMIESAVSSNLGITINRHARGSGRVVSPMKDRMDRCRGYREAASTALADNRAVSPRLP